LNLKRPHKGSFFFSLVVINALIKIGLIERMAHSVACTW
jgi:hypothetical protein